MNEKIKAIRKQIEQNNSGPFVTDLNINYNNWVQFRFINEHNNEEVLWDACVINSKKAFYEKVHDIAMEESFYIYPNGNNKTIMSTIKKRTEYIRKRTLELINGGNIKIIPWNIDIDQIDTSWNSIFAIMDVEYITKNEINSFIEDFSLYNCNIFKDKPKNFIGFTINELQPLLDSDWTLR